MTAMAEAICRELEIRKNEVDEELETIYFGGGTPSLLDSKSLHKIFDAIEKNFIIVNHPEVSIEANPDDLNKEKVRLLKSTPINRFSIGVQSFFDKDLKLMNRVHTSTEASDAIKRVQDAGFENITIDLIYGSQTTTDEMWEQNVRTAMVLGVPHISAYALTIEPKTLLHHKIKTGQLPDVDEEKQERQYRFLNEETARHGFIRYEISNFAKEGYESRHNSSYWEGKPYLGIGPSAHSYDGKTRSWNIANNALYIKNMMEGTPKITSETLSPTDRFNELVMIRLRMNKGLDLKEIKEKFPEEYFNGFQKTLKKHLDNKTLEMSDSVVRLTEKGVFLADGIAADFFRT